MVHELFKLADRSQRQQKKPEGSGNFQKWYFFCVAAFWLYVRCASWAYQAIQAQVLVHLLYAFM